VGKYFRSALVWIPFQIFLPGRVSIPGSFPFPGGWLIGGCLLLNLIAAHAVRFKLSWARSGILLVHGGLIVMLLSELFTGLFAVEGHMTIENGKSSAYVEHSRRVELAVVDPSDPATDLQTVVPGSRIRSGRAISHELLPFDIAVDRYMINSTLVSDPSAAPRRATAGKGLEVAAVERPEISGTDTKQRIDTPSAYLTLHRKGGGEKLGTWLVSLLLEDPQPVEVDGKSWFISLRFKRSHKPYRLHLIEFRHDKYIGTEIPKNYSSRVRLTDPSQGVDREILIYMNHPLRYGGETFYQADFLKGDAGTVLQVVKNPSWLLPYISCAMVALGMIAQFGIGLGRFLGRRAEE
jgi:hypothetical protein